MMNENVILWAIFFNISYTEVTCTDITLNFFNLAKCKDTQVYQDSCNQEDNKIKVNPKFKYEGTK